jgi:hypothetical protein
MIIGGTVNWYRDHLSFELIDKFVENTEKQVAQSILDYEQNRRTVPVAFDAEEDEEYMDFVETHDGLDSGTWDLRTVFKEFFPNLQRGSAFLTVLGYFEHELDDLCVLFQSEKGFKISYRDLKADGIDRSTSYLDKVAGLNLQKEKSSEWNRMKGLQGVRNAVAHRDGRLNADDKNVREVLAKLGPMASVNGSDQIMLNEGFLKNVTEACKDYFRFIDRSIQAKELSQKKGI